MKIKYVWSSAQENYQKYEPNYIPEDVSKNIWSDLKSKWCQRNITINQLSGKKQHFYNENTKLLF